MNGESETGDQVRSLARSFGSLYSFPPDQASERRTDGRTDGQAVNLSLNHCHDVLRPSAGRPGYGAEGEAKKHYPRSRH